MTRWRIGSSLTLATALLLTAALGAGGARVTGQPGPSYVAKTDAALDFLLVSAAQPLQAPLTGSFGDAVARIRATGVARVSVRFDHELTNEEIATLERLGVRFTRFNNQVQHSGTIYGLDAPAGAVRALVARDEVLRIESVWQPAVHDTLDVSVPEINADDMWQLLDGAANRITGQGLVVADFDTGIDVFHPDFWRSDGGVFNWIDANSNGAFNAGTDAVDLNMDGVAQASETLDFFEGGGNPAPPDLIYTPDVDWLYNDANNNGVRNFGAASGFGEADPTFGERIFLADDANHNGALDIGEHLLALGASKVRRTLNAGGTERIRGADLIQTEADGNGHGTSVCGIINGGTIGLRRYVGVAPDAELLVANRYANDFTVYIPWARNNGADVMLYEFGGWVQTFLDGSSNLELAIDAEAAAGIVQVIPAGNLGGSNKHAETNVAAAGATNFTFNVPATDDPATPADEDIETVFITALWRTTGNNLAFAVTTPGASTVNLPAAPGDTNWHSTPTTDGHTVFYRRENSARGTAKYDITIRRNDVVTGGWTLRVTNSGASAEHVDMYSADDRTSWGGGAVWTNLQSEANTITDPATADSAIVVASYSTRGFAGVAVGDRSDFSPTGPRIDGRAIMDIAAPGNFDVGSTMSKDSGNGALGRYRWFSGTSASGPHVAASAALLLQWNPALTPAQVETMIQQSARTDAFTGATPNDEWGFGKLDIFAAVNEAPTADANGPYTVECTGATTSVQLDGTGSTDPNAGDVLTYAWTTDCSGAFDDSGSATPVLVLNSAPGCFDCSVSLTVTDLGGLSDAATADITVQDTTPPVVVCPLEATLECTGQCGIPADDGAVLPWLSGATVTDVCDETPGLSHDAPSFLPLGPTSVTFTGIDDCYNSASCSSTLNVVDTTPPVITVNLNRNVLWPPNHKMVDITAAVNVTDVCDPNASFVLASISSDEPGNGLGDGSTTSDIQGADFGTPDVAFQLRSERSGNGDGRLYTIVYTGYDACDTTPRNTTDAVVYVEVPHDQSGHALSSIGFNAAGDDFAPGATTFALIVPSTDAFDATQINAVWAQVGNSVGVLYALETLLSDADRDGRQDFVATYAVADAQALRAASAPDELLAFRYELQNESGFVVANIFALGPPIDIGAPPMTKQPRITNMGTGSP